MEVFVLFCLLVVFFDFVVGLYFYEGVDWFFVEFRGWVMFRRSELQFYFKIGVSRFVLFLYQDNKKKNIDNDFFEMFLNSDGYVQFYVWGNWCFFEKCMIC